MSTKKIFGYGTQALLCAIAVMLALAVTGCESPIDSLVKSDLTGNVSLSNNSPKVGESITATYARGNGTGAQTWQWFRVGTGTEDLIQGETANTYTATADDVGKKLKAQISFDDQNGSLSATTTNAVTAVVNDITYTVAQSGGADNAADSTGIVFTFSASVDSLGLTAADITVGNPAAKGANATLSGTGATWTLSPITVTHAGQATVQIAKTGIAAGTQHVTVYKADETAPTLNSITAVYTPIAAIVYPTTSLDDLKAGLVVKAQYSDDDEETLSGDEYTLGVSGGGALTVGANTVTVTYTHDGVTKTAEFSVTVTAAPQTPTAADYDFGNLSQTAGSVTAVTVTPKAGKSTGAVSNILYNNATDIPQTAGTYPVTFDVAAATGWNAASGLSAGTLTVHGPSCECEGVQEDCDCGAGCDCPVCEPAPLIPYIITGSGTEFTATKDGAAIGTADQPIQTVIDAIRADANGANAAIQFGNGTDVLNIGTASALFTNGATAGGTWGLITLTGKITSANAEATEGTIRIGSAVSITSTADIANTASGFNVRAIYNAVAGTVTIAGGTVTGSIAVFNNSTGTVTISGGEISGSSQAVHNENTGTVIVTGTAVVTTRGDNSTATTINNVGGGSVIITGGTVSQTGTFSRMAVTSTNTASSLVLGGSPVITGPIQGAAGRLGVVTDGANPFNPSQTGLADFAPGSNTYTIHFAAYANNMILVLGGGSFQNAFALYDSAASSGTVLSTSGGNLVASSPAYSVASSGSSYTITAAADGTYNSVQDAVDYIKSAANGSAVSIQFGNGTDTIDTATTSVQFNNTGGTWGLITLSGKITSAISGFTGAIRIADAVSVTSTADIANTGNAAVHLTETGTGTVTISSGTVSSVLNRGAGTVTIDGGTVSSVSNEGTGMVTISGGNVGSVVSGSTGASSTSVRPITISGGTVASVRLNVASSQLFLLGNPEITGVIFRQVEGATVSVTGTPSFAPQGKVYKLGYYTTPAEGTVAVTGGAGFLANFALDQQPTRELEASGGNLTLKAALPPALEYVITGGPATFTATKVEDNTALPIGAGTTGTIAEALTAIRTDADGAIVSIQFGSGGTDVLNIGSASASFSGTATPAWGQLIFLTGSITSSNNDASGANAAGGTIWTAGAVNIDSTADIANTDNGTNAVGRAIRFGGTGTLTISGGKISALSGVAVHNGSTSANGIIIKGDALITSANALTRGTIYNQTNSPLTITGGTVQNTSTATNSNSIVTYAICNEGTGAVTISGGTITAAGAGIALRNASTGAVTISGGTITAPERAVFNISTGIINLGGNPAITGTIYQNNANASVRVTGLPAGTPAFAPTTGRVYTLDFADAGYTNTRVAVTGGGGPTNFAAYFTLPDSVTAWKLGASGNNLVIQTNP